MNRLKKTTQNALIIQACESRLETKALQTRNINEDCTKHFFLFQKLIFRVQHEPTCTIFY